MTTQNILNNRKYEDPSGTIIFPDNKVFRISYDCKLNKMRLRCLNQKDLDEIVEAFSDINPACFYMRQYGYSVPNKISIINSFGYFPTGFTFEILKHIKLKYGSLDKVSLSLNIRQYISDYLTPIKTIMTSKGIEKFQISNISEDSGRNKILEENGKTRFEYREYQKDAIEKLIFSGHGRGIIELGTSAGKSFIIANFIYNILKNISSDYKCMILVPNKQLVYQMYNDLVDYGFKEDKLTKFTAGLKKNEKFNADANVIIANRQYVFTKKNMLPSINVMFVDEVHTSSAKKSKDTIEEINPRILVGCTGTMPKGRYDSWVLNGMYGNVVFTKAMTELQNEGYVSKIKLYQVEIVDSVVKNDRNLLFHINSFRRYHPDENGYSEIPFNAAHDAEHEYYEKHYKDLYSPALKYISTFNENTLILFDRIEFGKRLTDLAKEIFIGREVHYIDGSVPIHERLEITNKLEHSGNNVLFAEFATFQVGISIHRLTNIAFVSSSKSFPRICQSIGRTLRLYKSKQYARVFDISFNCKYSQRHLRERLKIYKDMYNKIPDEKKTIVI